MKMISCLAEELFSSQTKYLRLIVVLSPPARKEVWRLQYLALGEQ
jgi:hypothetical protein